MNPHDDPLHNARAVVRTWRENDHHQAWGPAAQNRTPSYLNSIAAIAWSDVQRVADQAADTLVREGFLPGHEIVRDLRGVASRAAQHANHLSHWARQLSAVEQGQ